MLLAFQSTESGSLQTPNSPVGLMPAAPETHSSLATNRQLLSRWNLAAIMLIVGLVVWTGVERFIDPVGEKYLKILAPGNADFFFPFGGARALLLGANPYVNDLPGMDDPWHRAFGIVEGKAYRGLYPPTHFVLYVPLALITDDWRVAGRILFVVNLAAIGLMAVISWWLLIQITTPRTAGYRMNAILIPLLFVILSTNVATSMGLERGDGGDILGAALCWSAVVLFLKGWRSLPMFLAVPAVLLKGYPVFWGLGLGLLGLTRRTWMPVVAGTLAGVLVFLAPVARYLPEALLLIRNYTGITGNVFWWNHSFWNLFGHIDPQLAEPGRWIMTVYCVALSVISWLRARRALRAGSLPDAALWLCLFTVSSIEIMLGSARTSIVYDLIFIMPGLVMLLILPEPFLRSCGLGEDVGWSIGTLFLLSAFLLFKFAWFDSAGFPTPGLGMLLFLVTIGGIWVTGKLRGGRNQKT